MAKIASWRLTSSGTDVSNPPGHPLKKKDYRIIEEKGNITKKKTPMKFRSLGNISKIYIIMDWKKSRRKWNFFGGSGV
jgi:hypothetical protein